MKNKHPALFRNHAGPTPEKLAALREQLGLLGLSLGGGDEPQPKHYAELAAKIGNRPDREMIEIMLLRSMQQAVYAPENEGHFGLAYEHYAHFTSPIRRYPDLLVHRAIKAVLSEQKYSVSPNTWTELGAHTSMCERRADDASRDVENWLKTYYMLDKIGEVFGGKVSGVASFGIFVMLDEVHVEGAVHVSDLGEDYFHFRPEIMAMEGERSGVRFGVGDRVTVQVARADLDTSKIDLVLCAEPKRKRGKKKTDAPPPPRPTRGQNAKSVQAAAPSPRAKPAKTLKMVGGKITRVDADTAKPKRGRKKSA